MAVLDLKEANELIRQWHRHHQPSKGHKFSIGAEEGGKLVGAVIVGRPVARGVDHRTTAEVARLVTDGTKNACSFLYSAAARAVKELGYKRIQTYVLASESGTSLRAAGWRLDGTTKGGRWIRDHDDPTARQLLLDGGTRRGDQPMEPKQRWVKDL